MYSKLTKRLVVKYLPKVDSENTRIMSTEVHRTGRCSSFFIVDFEQVCAHRKPSGDLTFQSQQ